MVLLPRENKPEVILDQHKNRDRGHDGPDRNKARVFVRVNQLRFRHKAAPCLARFYLGKFKSSLPAIPMDGKMKREVARTFGKVSGFSAHPSNQEGRAQQGCDHKEPPHRNLAHRAGKSLFFYQGIRNPPYRRAYDKKHQQSRCKGDRAIAAAASFLLLDDAKRCHHDAACLMGDGSLPLGAMSRQSSQNVSMRDALGTRLGKCCAGSHSALSKRRIWARSSFTLIALSPR